MPLPRLILNQVSVADPPELITIPAPVAAVLIAPVADTVVAATVPPERFVAVVAVAALPVEF